MGLFTKVIDVEGHLNKIDRLIESKDEKKQIPVLLKQLREYITQIIDTHGSTLFHEEVIQLKRVIELIRISEGTYVSPSKYNELKAYLRGIFSNTRVYLMRHTDKPKGISEKWSALAAIQKLAVSKSGVGQARKFAQFLAEEVLLCPKPVNVIFNFSEVPRTQVYAEIIKRKLMKLVKSHGKRVRIASMQQSPPLYFRFTDEAVAETMNEYKQSEFLAFSYWMEGKYKLLPPADQVARELTNWIRQGLSLPSRDEWTIVIGISHSFIVDTYLYSRTHEHKSLIATADYAKFIGNMMYYKGKWYHQ